MKKRGLGIFTLIVEMIAVAAIFYAFTRVLNISILERPTEVDDQTKRLCREWAAADHSGGVPPERLKWLKDRGVWDEFDWYGSCILNNSPDRFDQMQTIGDDTK